MLNEGQKIELAALVKLNLDRAETIWNKVGHEFAEAMAMDESMLLKKAETLPSMIPGHELVSDIRPTVDQFIAFVADMRDSSKHLLNAISVKTAKVSQLQRVFYETSALLPALAKTVQYENGQVTEYLGDGVLALFLVNEEDRAKSIYDSYNATENCITETKKIVNAELDNRYSLPDLDIGVGLSFSKAIVTLVGLQNEKHPKVIGECVYRASKLSAGRNEIYIDNQLKALWPKKKDGVLKFVSKSIRGVDGYLAKESSS
jgi:hypothetical protein